MDKFAFLRKLREVKRLHSFFTSAIFIVIALSSCKNEDCVSTSNNYLLVNFISADTLEGGEIELMEMDTLFYSITAMGNDSVFYSKAKKVSSLQLPVDPATDRTTFQFTMIDSIRFDTTSVNPIIIDTTYFLNEVPHEIIIAYTRKYRIISESCGIEISYSNLEVESITFPSSALINNYLSRFNTVNIEVYF